jgi:hypothetical protein
VRDHPKSVAGTAIAASLPSVGLSLLWSLRPDLVRSFFAGWIALLPTLVVAYFVTLVVFDLSTGRHSGKRPYPGSPSLITFVRFALTRLITAVLLGLLALACAVPVLLLEIVFGPRFILDLLSGLFFSIGLTLGFLLYGLSGPASLVERLTPLFALKRSRLITAGKRKQLLVLCLVPGLITALLFARNMDIDGIRSFGLRETPAGFSREQAKVPDPSSISEALGEGAWTFVGSMNTAVWAVLLTCFFLRLKRLEASQTLPTKRRKRR